MDGDCFRNRKIRGGSPRSDYQRGSPRAAYIYPISNISSRRIKMRIKNESKDWRDVIVLPRSSILFPGIRIILRPSEIQDIRLIFNLLEMFHFLC